NRLRRAIGREAVEAREVGVVERERRSGRAPQHDPQQADPWPRGPALHGAPPRAPQRRAPIIRARDRHAQAAARGTVRATIAVMRLVPILCLASLACAIAPRVQALEVELQIGSATMPGLPGTVTGVTLRCALSESAGATECRNGTAHARWQDQP